MLPEHHREGKGWAQARPLEIWGEPCRQTATMLSTGWEGFLRVQGNLKGGSGLVPPNTYPHPLLCVPPHPLLDPPQVPTQGQASGVGRRGAG